MCNTTASVTQVVYTEDDKCEGECYFANILHEEDVRKRYGVKELLFAPKPVTHRAGKLADPNNCRKTSSRICDTCCTVNDFAMRL